MTITAERRREIAIAGGRARAKSFTPEHQRAARAALPHDVVVRAARAGFKAVIERKGGRTINRVLEAARRHRLSNPSKPERAMMELLDGMGVAYEREHNVARHVYRWVDFYIPSLNAAIQVHGGQHFVAGWGDEVEFARLRRCDELVRRACKRAGIRLIEIDARHMRSATGMAAITEAVGAFLCAGEAKADVSNQ